MREQERLGVALALEGDGLGWMGRGIGGGGGWLKGKKEPKAWSIAAAVTAAHMCRYMQRI